MGLLDKIISAVSNDKDKVEEVRDKKLEEIESDKIKEDWYVSKTDKFAYVRVIRVDTDANWVGIIYYRTIANVNEIDRNNIRAQLPDGTHINVTEYAHNREVCTETIFRNKFQKVNGVTLLHDLEERYQDVIKGWHDRLLEYERTNSITHDEADSQRRLNQFLHPTSGVEAHSMPANEPEQEIENVERNNRAHATSGSINVNDWDFAEYNRQIEGHNRAVAEERGETYIPPRQTLNPYGGYAEIPASLMPKMPPTQEQIKQIKQIEQIEKLPEYKKRLESIE